MRSLAGYVMTGRKQAVIAVVLLGLIPLANLLNPVIVGLIILRKGWQEGLVVFAWAVLPLLGWASLGDLVPLIMLLGLLGLGLLLRETGSWEFTLLAAIAVGIGTELYFRLQPAVLDVLMVQVQAYLQDTMQQTVQIEELRAALLDVIGVVYMFLAIVLLMLSRWMQATLFNQGGFQQEFHHLRIKHQVVLGLLGLMLLSSTELVPASWLLYWALPLAFSGVALVHAVVKYKQLSRLWLLTFYVSLLLPLVMQSLILVALVDSWYDFRGRMRSA